MRREYYPKIEQDLRWLYLECKFSLYEVAQELNLPYTTLYKYMKKYQIPRRSQIEAQALAHNKKSVAMKGKCQTEEHKRKRSLAMKANPPDNRGNKNPNYRGGEYRPCPICGKEVWVAPCKQARDVFCSQSCKTKAQMANSKFREYLSKIQKRNWQDPDFVRKMMVAFHKKPTRPEHKLEALLNEFFPQFKYNGDGRLGITLGGLTPDFVNINGRKDLIEVFGDYYHSPKILKDRWEGSELGKIMVYNSIGWKCLVIWEHELKDKEAVIAKIRNWSRLP